MSRVDAHHAANAAIDTPDAPRAPGSVDPHHAADAFTDTTVALMSYNLGIQNTEPLGKNWAKKYVKLQNDIKSAFTNETGIQVLLLSEFGNMFTSIDLEFAHGITQPTGDTVYCTRELFENLLADIDLPHINVIADAPYVALIDSQCWGVKHREILHKMCTKELIKVQHLILEHVDTSEPLRCFNAHMPTKFATVQRKEDCVKKMCDIATYTGVSQPSACMPWIIAGDLNVDLGTMAKWCHDFVERGVPCFSKSEWPQIGDAQKADHALSQGITLLPIRSWLGIHSQPCASDAHDAVVVVGALAAMDSTPAFTRAPLANTVWSKAPRLTAPNTSNASSGVSQSTEIAIQDSRHAGRASSTYQEDLPAAISEKRFHVDNSGVPQPSASGETLPADMHDVIEDTSAPGQRFAEEHARDSGVPQPSASGETLPADTHDVIEDTSARGQRFAEEHARDTSGVLQPAAAGERPQASIHDVNENISQKAMADNGSLKEDMHGVIEDTSAPGQRFPEEHARDTSGVLQPAAADEWPWTLLADNGALKEDTSPTPREDEAAATTGEILQTDSSGVLERAASGKRLYADMHDLIEDTLAPGERLPEEDAPDTSGVLQPAATGERLEADIQDVIENISQMAMADNGELKEGDSPEASRYEPPRLRFAAQQLLEMLCADQGGYGIRPNSELLRIMSVPIRVRENMVNRIADYRGVSQPADTQGAFTVQQYLEWYNSHPLSDSDFEWALAQWKKEFPMAPQTREKIEAWQKQDTRASKQSARNLQNGAFKVFLHQECTNKQLAIAFLKHPAAMVNTLLEWWAQYLESPEYLQEKARAQKLDESNAEAVDGKNRQVQLKLKVHRLRHQVRQAKRLHRNQNLIKEDNRKLYQKWVTGKLAEELDECTRTHGYGKLQSTGEMLQTGSLATRNLGR